MELLKHLYEIYSPSGGEKQLKRFIKKWVKDNIPDAEIRTDNNDGNVYIVRGVADVYPCVVAHLDQVQRNHSKDFIAVETDDIIFGYSPSNRCREGLGADDKNGIWIALQCLKEFDIIKVAFFVGEEIGCVGSGRCDMWWFENCQYIIEPDRRGSSDLITNISGDLCSEAFKDYIPMKDFGYSEKSGLMTDVLELLERGVGISCINLSCGYYEPHTDDEFTVKVDLLNCLELVKTIIVNCGVQVFHHEYQCAYKSSYSSSYNGMSRWDWEEYDAKYGYGWEDYRDFEAHNSLKEPTIPKASDYDTAYQFIDVAMYMNFESFMPDDLYPYIASDLDTFGVSEEEYLDIAEQIWEFYSYNSY